MASQQGSPLLDAVSWQDEITPYDESHFTLYVQLLDGHAAGLSDDDLCRTVLNLEADENAKRILASHLARARWMTEHGFRHLIGLNAETADSRRS